MSVTKKAAGRAGRRRTDRGLELVGRGPNWLFMRITGDRPADLRQLSDRLWEVCRRHFTYRMVLELDELGELDDHVIEELVHLQQRMLHEGGALRLCGLKPRCAEAMLAAARSGVLRSHPDHHTAVGDSWCGGPAEDPKPDPPGDGPGREDQTVNPLPTKPR